VPNVIKIDLDNFELYRFKVGTFFWDTVYDKFACADADESSTCAAADQSTCNDDEDQVAADSRVVNNGQYDEDDDDDDFQVKRKKFRLSTDEVWDLTFIVSEIVCSLDYFITFISER